MLRPYGWRGRVAARFVDDVLGRIDPFPFVVDMREGDDRADDRISGDWNGDGALDQGSER